MRSSSGVIHGADEVLAEVAKRATALVGDGCVIRAVEGGAFHAVAAEHVLDEDRRKTLLSGPPVRLPGGWLGQALDRRQTVRLPGLDADALTAAGLSADAPVADVMIVPFPTIDAVVVATRDRWSDPYNGSQRRQIEALVCDAEARIREHEPAEEGEEDTGPFDPNAARLLELTSAALWVVDDAGSTVYVNETASELVGFPADEILGRPIAEFLGRVSQRRRGGFHGSETIERPLMRADGEVVWLLASSQPLGHMRAGHKLYTLTPFDDHHTREVALRLRLSRTEALLELAEAAGAGVPLDELLRSAVGLAADQLDVELAGVGSFDVDLLEARPLAIHGWPDPNNGDGAAPVPAFEMVEDSATVAALRSGDGVLVWDYETQSIYQRDPLLEKFGIRSAAVVPFAGGSAAVAAHSSRPGAIDGEGLQMLETVARLLAPRWDVATLAARGSNGHSSVST